MLAECRDRHILKYILRTKKCTIISRLFFLTLTYSFSLAEQLKKNLILRQVFFSVVALKKIIPSLKSTFKRKKQFLNCYFETYLK